MTAYQPGDVLRDKAGYPAIVHYAEGVSTLCTTPQELFTRAVRGNMPLTDYVGIVANHVDVQVAYNYGHELPAGATITNEPERLQGLFKE
ncbi:MAG TPA: hypothetical protein VNG32_01775 [Candidatus Dormibacteraeota bacterium]|nr:hypothetical protein [Candidatus Dormibacteraeota bacterium]